MTENTAPIGSGKNILITGSSGLIGSALSKHLERLNYRVYPLRRNTQEGPFYYCQDKDFVHLSPDIPLHGVVNLAGANISDRRWNATRKRVIQDSRCTGTRLLTQALAQLPHKPAVLLSASAIGFYGDTGQDWVDEDSPAGDDFLARLASDWEQATQPAQEAGIRTAHLRFGLVLSPDGGVLKNFILPLRLACVGRIGGGDQFMSWIAIDDAVATIDHLLHDETLAGPFNLVSDAVSNERFSAALARALRRPRLPPLPAAVLRVMFGEMADAALLASSRVRSKKLPGLNLGQSPGLEAVLERILAP